MKYCSHHWLNRRCREAGKKNGECDACILAHGDPLTVDETHPAYPQAAVSLLQKAGNFAASTARHVAAGMPQCTQEQIDARFAVCQTCPHFDGKACRMCGCPVKREQAFVSKLAWANEKCPVGKWGPCEKDSST
jgi:hypothetical protein